MRVNSDNVRVLCDVVIRVFIYVDGVDPTSDIMMYNFDSHCGGELCCLEFDLNSLLFVLLIGECVRSGRVSLSALSMGAGSSSFSESESWGGGVGCL